MGFYVCSECGSEWRTSGDGAVERHIVENCPGESAEFRLRREIAALKEQLGAEKSAREAAEKLSSGYAEAVKFDDIRHHDDVLQINALHQVCEEQNYWAWQGDGKDGLDTLSCPIVIRPEQLRDLLTRAALSPDAGKALMEELEAAREIVGDATAINQGYLNNVYEICASDKAEYKLAEGFFTSLDRNITKYRALKSKESHA